MEPRNDLRHFINPSIHPFIYSLFQFCIYWLPVMVFHYISLTKLQLPYKFPGKGWLQKKFGWPLKSGSEEVVIFVFGRLLYDQVSSQLRHAAGICWFTLLVWGSSWACSSFRSHWISFSSSESRARHVDTSERKDLVAEKSPVSLKLEAWR